MKKSSNTEAELKKSVAYKKSVCILELAIRFRCKVIVLNDFNDALLGNTFSSNSE